MPASAPVRCTIECVGRIAHAFENYPRLTRGRDGVGLRGQRLGADSRCHRQPDWRGRRVTSGGSSPLPANHSGDIGRRGHDKLSFERKARLLPASRLATALVLWLPLIGGAAPAATPVAVQLVLAVDVSGSVNQARFELQREGYAAAFRSPAVLQAIRSTVTRSIAVAMVQWTGPTLHVVAVDWMLIEDAGSAERFAASIEQAPRVLFSGGTSIRGAIDFALAMFPRGPFQAARHVIDVSGDGANNRGRPVEDARDEAVRAGAVINGLPILTVEPDLDGYYRQSVIGGPGAFVIAANRYEEFARAIQSKLVTEIASAAGRRWAAPDQANIWSTAFCARSGLTGAVWGSVAVTSPAFGLACMSAESMVSTSCRCSIARRILWPVRSWNVQASNIALTFSDTAWSEAGSPPA